MESVDGVKNLILSKLSIYDVIGETIKLTDRSGLKVGLCPFHDESSPSFTVYPDHFFCFGCRENGDIITFVRKTQGLGFIDALKSLAGKAGIDPVALDSRQGQKERSESAQLFKIMLAAQARFKENLHSARGLHALEYLRQRGFSDENIKAYGFGLAFDEPHGMLNALTREGHSPRQVEACSLATPSAKSGKLYDFYRNRVMVPIFDHHGRLVAFGGRALDDFPPKYKNSRDSRLFDKSRTLFGYNIARESIRKGQPAVVVEGYMDVLQLWQNGLTGAVACMGTALKGAHLSLLANITNRVTLLFDGDEAGQKASLATVSSALSVPKIAVKVACLPPGHDPDSFVREFGAEKLRELIEQATSILEFAISEKLKGAGDMGIPDLIRKEILPWIVEEPDQLRRGFLINKVAHLSGISRSQLELSLEEMTLKKRHGPPPPESPGPQKAPMKDHEQPAQRPLKPLSHLEFELLAHLYFAEPGEVEEEPISSFIDRELDMDELWRGFAEEMLAYLKQPGSPHLRNTGVWHAASDPRALRLIEIIQNRAEAFAVKDRSARIHRITNEYLLKKHRSTVSKLRQQLTGLDREQAMEILGAIQKINTEIVNIQKTF